MYLWERTATRDWLNANEQLLEAKAPRGLAVVSMPARARVSLQIVCQTRMQASRLVRDFQGSADRLPRDWREKYLPPQIHAPIRVGRRLLVVAEANRSSRPQLVIPVAGAFGTGDHPTTAMCLRLLEEATRNALPGWCLLDAGTGTGILALAAHFFGARDVLGIDNDPRAIAHAQQNARLNQINDVKFLNRDLLAWKSRTRYDLIAANLFSEMLIAAFPSFRRALRATGRIIISGILLEQEKPVVSALRRRGFELEQLRRRGKWIALLARIDSSSALSKRNGKP
jgi:ribosomal protein L11 methyltransferase